MKRLNQNGFSAFEITLLILVVAILGFAGYTVFQNNNPAVTNNTPTTKKEAADTKPQGPVFNQLPAGWTEYKNDEKGFRFGYAQEWGTLKGDPLSTTDYQNDSKNLQGRVTATISTKEGYSIVASKYGATIKPSADGKSWIVLEENPVATDDYRAGDTYKTKDIKVNGGTIIDLTVFDEDCTLPRYLLTLKNSYVVISMPELCPVNNSLPVANKDAYAKLITDFISSITIY